MCGRSDQIELSGNEEVVMLFSDLVCGLWLVVGVRGQLVVALYS